MIFFFKSDGTLIKSAPETVYQGSAEAGKVYVVAPLNANMLVDVYYELPNGERWGAYLLENNGTVINNEEFPDGWALWSTTLESAITQYAGTLKAQFGFYQSGTADKVPLITSQGVTITIAKGVIRDLPSAPNADVYAQIVNAISSIKQDIANLPNEYLSNTNEDKIALKNNTAIEYSENATAGTIAKRDSYGKINVADGTEDLNAVNVRQLNAANITNIDLNTGDTTVEYDTGLGITVNAKGTLTHKNGSTEQPTTKFEVPIIAGSGVSIDKKEAEEKVEIKSLNSNLENGTADVLIETTDTNHSFKVMTDGRAKVQTAPTENDDIVRLNEFTDLTKEVADKYVAKVTLKYRVILDITLQEDTKEVYITTDENGNPLKLKNVFVQFSGQFTGTVGYRTLQLEFNNGILYGMRTAYNINYIKSDNPKDIYGHWAIVEKQNIPNRNLFMSHYPADILLTGWGSDYNSMQGLSSSPQKDVVVPIESPVISSINNIRYGQLEETNGLMAAGSRIFIWGIDDDE